MDILTSANIDVSYILTVLPYTKIVAIYLLAMLAVKLAD